MKKLISFCGITILLSLITIPIGSYITLNAFSDVNDFYFKNGKFSEEKLISYIKELRIKYPHIVLAQAKIESGNYSSFIFKNNNNLFGMRYPKIRTTTSKGSKLGYAYYSSWRESVIDYALYSTTQIKNVYSENEYYNFLNKVYAEDSLYVITLKSVVEKHKLKDLF
jgi:hypothetical protein